MIKQAPRPFQVILMGGFVLSCVAVVLYLWLGFGGSVPLRAQSYRFHVNFPEATQLAVQGDVRISGVPVGKVQRIDVGPGNTTDAEIEIKAKYAPIPRDARATLRQKTLLGETYIDLSPGDKSKGNLSDGGTLPNSAVHPTVELDEIFRSFDFATRKGFQTWMQSQAMAVDGRGADINAAFANLPLFVDGTDDLMRQLNAQSRAVRGMFRDTGHFFDAISERDGQLSSLISHTDRLFGVTDVRNRELANIFREFPRFQRESRLTLPALTRLAKVGEPVARRLQPAASEFEPVFQNLQRLGPEFRGFFERLGPVITAAERGVPSFERIMRGFPSVLDAFHPFLRNLNPVIGHLSANRREITSFLGNATASGIGRDIELPRTRGRGINFLRVTQSLSPHALSFYPRSLGSTRSNAYTAPGGLGQLPQGLSMFDPGTCSNGDPAPPETSDPPTVAPLVKLYAFRTDGRNVARPRCAGQGNYPGHGTSFPRLEPEP